MERLINQFARFQSVVITIRHASFHRSKQTIVTSNRQFAARVFLTFFIKIN